MIVGADDYLQRAYDIRKSHRTPEFLRQQHHLRTILADRGWYEIIEPENGEGTALAHTSDLETYIVGFIMNDHVILDPGEDYEVIRLSDYPTYAHFIVAFETVFNRLVKDWFPE